MANLLTDVVYTNATDVKDTTDVVALQSESDATVNKLIVEAQYVIDKYIGSYGIKFDSTQNFIFPINVSDVSTLPSDISLATVFVVEQLYLEWATTFSWEYDVIEEKSWPDSVKFWWSKSQKYITDKVKAILNKYASSFVKQVV